LRAEYRPELHAFILVVAGCSTLGSGVLLLSTSAHAQTASQITPQTFAPPVQGGLGGGVGIGASPGLDTPAGAEKLFVRLRDIRVEGGLPELAGETAAVRAKLMGQRVSGAAIFAAARELEAAYAKAGYVLVRVTLPPQKLVSGAVLRLVVIDGMIERIETKGLPERVRARIAAVVGPLTGRRGLMLHELERRILLAGDTPGVILSSALAPGSVTGATVLVIEAKYQPVNEIVTADNSLAPALGRYQIGVGADFNSILGFGELGYVRINGDPGDELFSDHPRNRSLAVGEIVPLGIDGMTFNVEATDARATPEASAGTQASDQFDRLSFRLREPWIRTRDFNFAQQLVFDLQDERDGLIAPAPLALFEDRLRIVRLVNEANYLTSWGATISGALTGSAGLDVLGARTAAEATPTLPLSRQGADATFAKVDGTLGYTQAFQEHLTGSFTVRGQYSFGSALLDSEQIGIAGPGSLSAFDAGTLQGDSGVAGRGELGAPFTLPTLFGMVGIVASPYVFGAVGEVFLEDPTVFERHEITAGSYGFGVHLGGGAAGTLSNGALTLEFSRQARDDGVKDDNRFTLVTSLKF
jgi:hemolysin activation/secretion protein